jgi:hypothetical protein
LNDVPDGKTRPHALFQQSGMSRKIELPKKGLSAYNPDMAKRLSGKITFED